MSHADGQNAGRGPAGPSRRPTPAKGLRVPPPGRRALSGALALGLGALPALAQDGGVPPNPLLTFNFSSSLNVSDNYDLSVDSPGHSTFLDNTLGLAYQTETEVQSLRFGLSGVARIARLPEEGTDTRFDNQTALFDYRREGVDSQLRLHGRYNRADLAFFDPLSLIDLDDPIDENDLVTLPSGYRETVSLGLGFETGLSSPMGFSFSADTRRRDFIDLDEEDLDDLYDTVTDSLTASVSALVTPSTRLSLGGTISHYMAEDEEETDRMTRSLSLGASHETARGLTLSGSLGYQTIDTDETDPFGLRSTTSQDGGIGSLALQQELTNGSIGVSASHSMTVNGGRSTVQLLRSLDLPDGSLAMSIGVSSGDSGRNSVVGDINYSHNLVAGRVWLTLARTVTTDDDDEDLEVTRASAGWSHDLTAVSGLIFNVDYLSTNAIGEGTDRQRGRLRASYRHELTRDWDLTGGYEYTVSQREGQDDATENSVFLTIGRQFQFRP